MSQQEENDMSYFEKRPDGSYAPNPHPQGTPGVHKAHAPDTPNVHNDYARPPGASAFGEHAHTYSSNQQNPHSLRYDPAPRPSPKKKRSTAKFLGGTAFLLACAMAGFGGSALAINLLAPTNNSSIIYQSAGGAVADEISTEGSTIADIAQTSGQSVVSIQTESVLSNILNQTQEVVGAGSGVIISEDGLILTNNHVVEGAQNITVTLVDGRQFKAAVLGTDSATDVALIQIEAEGLAPVVLADSSEIQVGDFCLAIGNPTGELGGTVTDGIISALEREITIQGTPMTLIQMSAPVNPGNSGGGLFNSRGELVGIVNAKNGDSGNEGLGFAIPINTAMDVAEELLENGYVQGRPMLGITAVTVSEQDMASVGVSRPGLYVNEVVSGSGAEEAGLQSGDRIATFEGVEIVDLFDLSSELAKFNPGDTVSLEIERDGSLYSVELELDEQQPSNVA